MKDIFKREAKIGDTILFIYRKQKHMNIGVIGSFVNLFGAPAIKFESQDTLAKKCQSDFLILKRADGTVYFDNENLPLNCWATGDKDKEVL